MATRNYINGKDVILFIKRNNAVIPETTFKAIACLESNSFSLSKEKKVVNNKCTGNWEDGISGSGSWNMSANGQAITDIQTAEINYQVLADLAIKGEKFEVKMSNADGSYYRGGEALITEFSEDAGTDDPLSFTVTINGLGTPIIIKPTP